MQGKTPKIQKGDLFVFGNDGASGHAQKGHRPHVIVTQIVGNVVTVAPCTTSASAKHFKHIVELTPTTENGLDKISFVLIFQSFACDTSVLHNKIGHLSIDEINKIKIEYIRYISE